MSLLLDTSAVIYLMERKNPEIARLITLHNRDVVASIVTKGELIRGTHSVARPEIAHATLDGFNRVCTWLPIDPAVATWGVLASKLRRSVGANDLWIIATAMTGNHLLVTGDHRMAKIAADWNYPHELVSV